MKKILMLCFVIVIVTTARSQGSPYPYVIPNTDWINYFSQRSSTGNAPSALDANSSSYLTGFMGNTSTGDLLTIKYDSTGAQSYTYTYNNGGFDNGKAIKIDAAGYAYVAGVSYDAISGNDYVIIKLAPNGSQSWVRRYDQSNNTDEARDICVDANGDVYVTGRSKNSGGKYKIVTLKLNGSNGTIIWAHTYSGSNLDDIGNGIVLSATGSDVYITGNTTDVSNGTDLVAFSLNATTGSLNWAQRVDGTSNSNDAGNALILLGSDIVVCGELNNTTTGSDYVVIRFDGSTGSNLWQISYDYGNSTDRATALARDSAGNIGVVGKVISGSTYEYHTLLINGSGSQYAVNIESTGLITSTTDPKICNDTIAHHWYVSGEKLKNTKDIFVYQIVPSGNTGWRKTIDGQNVDVDAATGIAVNGVGVVYVAALSKNSSADYDYTAIKLNQTPVYFPPDIVANELPSVRHLFYENKGQLLVGNTSTLATEILFSTMDEYPTEFFKADRFSYKLFRLDTLHSGMDTTQRIDINLYGSNPLAEAYPFEPRQGLVNFMISSLPSEVLDVQGYQRYFIPNIYPYIDLHYYSNEAGLKMYYVVKPFANPANIQWEIVGATSTTINGSGELEIRGFNATQKFSVPKVYTVNWSGNAVALSSTVSPAWTHSGTYGISVPTYSTNWPLIIEIDNGSASTATTAPQGNLNYMSYYGGPQDEGFKTVKVDRLSKEYVCLGSTSSYDPNGTFPLQTGANITGSVSGASGSAYIGMAYFDSLGVRLGANVYGIAGMDMQPLDMIVHKKRMTIIGNVSSSSSAFPPSNMSFTTPGTYSSTNGPGYLIQFELYQNSPGIFSINKVKWITRLNGYAAGIDMKPNTKEIYVASSINTSTYTPDLMSQSGSLNLSSVTGAWNGQVSKFDSTGVRKWSSLFQIGSSSISTNLNSRYCDGSNTNTKGDYYRKLKIDCDNYGFALAGDLDTNNLSCPNKYGAATTTTFSGHYDGFVARFNSKDSLVFATYLGGSADDVLNDVEITGSNEITVLGYSASQEYKKFTKFASQEFIDTIVSPNIQKILINKFDTIGNRTWGTLFGGNTNDHSNGWCITKDNLNKLYFSGRTYSLNLAVVNGGQVFSQYSPQGYVDCYIISFDNTNKLIWNTYYGGNYSEAALSLDFNPSGNRIMTAGLSSTQARDASSGFHYFPCVQANAPYATSSTWYTNYINADISSYSANYSKYDAYIGWFYTAIPMGIKEYFADEKHTGEDLIAVFPNPTNDVFYVALDKSYNKNVRIDVYNNLGQLVITKGINEAFEKTIVPLTGSNMTNGVYIVKVSDAHKSTSKKLIIAGK